MHIEIYFSSTIPVATILATGNILAIKAPRLEMGKYGPKIRVIHPSDIMILPPGHALLPEAFSTDFKVTTFISIWDCERDCKGSNEKRRIYESH